MSSMNTVKTLKSSTASKYLRLSKTFGSLRKRKEAVVADVVAKGG